MPGKRERELIAGYAGAVIADPDQFLATGDDIDRNRPGASVQAVLDQLLDDRSGPLDDFAGGNLVDKVTGELADGHEFAGQFT
jgi:hypothetical protein